MEVVRLLIQHGADLAAQAKDGWTPLHWASEEGHVEVVRLLIEHGADLAAQGEDGSTPLHWASERGHVEVVQLLEHEAKAAAITETSYLHSGEPLSLE